MTRAVIGAVTRRRSGSVNASSHSALSPLSAELLSPFHAPFAFCSDQNKTKSFRAFIQKPLFNHFFCVCAFLLQEVGSIIGKVCLFYFSVRTHQKHNPFCVDCYHFLFFICIFTERRNGQKDARGGRFMS